MKHVFKRHALVLAMACAVVAPSFGAAIVSTSGGAVYPQFKQPGIGAVPMTVNAKLAETISARDFGVIANGVTDSTAALNAFLTAAANRTAFIPAGNYYFTGMLHVPANTRVVGEGYATRLHPVNASGNTMTMASNSSLENLRLEGATPGGVKISGGASNVMIDKVFFKGVNQSVWLHDATQVTVQNSVFDTVMYGVIQQFGKSSSHVKVFNNTARNMKGDFVEANCASAAPSEDWIISGNQFLGSAGFPAVATEKRFVGITSVKNVTITNNIVKNVAGDSAVHLEGTRGRVTVSGNHFSNSIGTNYLYLLHSEKDVIISNNWFIQDDVTLPAMTMIGMNSNVYTNAVTIIGNHFVGNANMTVTAIGAETHTNIKVIGNTFESLKTGMSGSSTKNVIINSNEFDNVNQCVVGASYGRTGGAFSDVTMTGNRFNCNTDAVYVRRNTSGSAPSERWTITGNYFGANATANDTIDFLVTGNTVAAGKTMNFGGTQYAGSVRYFQSNNLQIGSGLVP